jgi:hypothetical protein
MANTALFFEGFRAAAARLPAGLVRPGPPAPPEALAAAEARLGRPLPPPFAEFLRSFDGADLFHESIVVAGVGPGAVADLVALNEACRRPEPEEAPRIRPGDLAIASRVTGELYVLSAEADGTEPRVYRVEADGDERWLAGSSFPRWLDAIVAREQVLYDSDGEFLLDAFEPDGAELTPIFALRQAERALKKDPDAAEHHHELALACRRLGRLPRAAEAFARAATLDPENPWPAFDLGRVQLALGASREAWGAFHRASEAAAEGAGSEQRPRFLAFAARAALDAGLMREADEARTAALAARPDLPEQLRRSAEAAEAEEDPEAAEEAARLLAVFDTAVPLRRMLPVLRGQPEVPPAPRPPSVAPGRTTKPPGARPPSGAERAAGRAAKPGAATRSGPARPGRPGAQPEARPSRPGPRRPKSRP